MKFYIRKLFSVVTVLVISLATWDYIRITEAGPAPGVHVDGYQEMEEPFYPFQQYIQVRKTYTVEHVPVYEQSGDEPTSSNLQAQASNSPTGSGDHQQAASYQDEDHNSQNHYVVPRLREEIDDYKKQEVYEEKGYGDSDYDHHSYGERGHGKDYHPSSHNDYDNSDRDHDHEASSHSSSSSGAHRSYPSRSRGSHVKSLHTPDGSSTKILEYVASTQHDSDADSKGIYAARDNIYCPEVIDFDLSSKSMKMGKGGGGQRQRLRGLGSKITCLKNKYFGSEPLPRAIFHDPSESTGSAIQAPSYDNFFHMVRQNIDSSSSFQNSKVPF